MKIITKAKITETGLLLEYPTKAVKAKITELVQAVEKKYDGFLTVDIKKPYRSRTTGKGSQNNYFYALVTQICVETGNDMEDVKDALKERACSRGYPYRINKLSGTLKPYSTTEVNTVEMGILIDEAIKLCVELGIVIERPEEPIPGTSKMADEALGDIY